MRFVEIAPYILSLLFFLSGGVFFFCLSRGERISRRLVWLTLFLVLAIIPLSLSQTGDQPTRAFGFLPRTMQAFSLDFDYDSLFVPEGQTTGEMGAAGALQTVRGWSLAIMIYKAILYSVAPIVGGAVIYDVLAGVSPNLRLLFARRRRLYIFSELNERSLGLAQSIVSEKKRGRRPVIIFTGCGEGGRDDVRPMVRARLMQAICLPNDVPECHALRRARQCVFFLMDLNGDGSFEDTGNLSTLYAMLDAENPVWPGTRGCHIFFFTDTAATLESTRMAKLAFDKRHEGDGQGEVRLHIVRDHVQVANALMLDHPLYEGLSRKAKGEPLRVLIIGRNEFSREVFKTVFWCGQLLDHPLQIVLAYAGQGGYNGRAEEEVRLGIECPELFESCTPESECLRQTIEGGYSAPYAALSFIEARPDQFFDDAFLTTPRSFQYGSRETFSLVECDFMILMTGSDRNNIEMAGNLWRRLVRMKLAGEPIGRTTIAVAIENDELSRIAGMRHEKLGRAENDIALVSFGAIQDRFCWENIFHSGIYHHRRASEITLDEAMHSIAGMDATKDDIYNEWSNQARQVHLRYKMFSALHRELAPMEDREGVLRDKLDYCRRVKADPALFDRLSWLEHRRWNAFLRTQGFQQPPRLFEKLQDLEAGRLEGEDWRALSLYAYKNVPARLHPNLVESATGVRGDRTDLLDLASDMRDLVDRLRDSKVGDWDIKYYDRPTDKYGPTLDLAEVCATLMGKEVADSGKPLEAAWAELKRRCSDIDQSVDPKHPGQWFAEGILSAKHGDDAGSD